MEWISNASTIASLVLAIFGIGGYFYGIVTYLKKKASPTQQDTAGSAQAPSHSSQKSSVPYKPLSWLQWTEFFAGGLVDMADFVLTLILHKEYDAENEIVRNKLGYCLMVCAAGVFFGEIILGITIGFFLSALGMKDPSGAAIVITTILLFMTFSFMYIYHVGLRIEHYRLREQYQEMRKQSSPRQ